jgi:hypothetical protein
MSQSEGFLKGTANRRSFLKNGMITVGAVTARTGLLTGGSTPRIAASNFKTMVDLLINLNLHTAKE